MAWITSHSIKLSGRKILWGVKTWSLALCNLFNSHFSVVSLLFVLGPSIHFTCGWFIQSLWPLKLCLLLCQHENLLLFIWKEMSAQVSSCSLRARCSPCTSVFCGLSVNANNVDLDCCITGKVGSLNVMVSFPPETIKVLEPLIHQLHPLWTNDIQTSYNCFLYRKVQNGKSISNDPPTAWKKILCTGAGICKSNTEKVFGFTCSTE